MKSILTAILGCTGCALFLAQPASAQVTPGQDQRELVLGAVQVDEYAVKLLVACSGDGALLELGVTQDDGPEKYVPMFASTYRGIPPVDLDVLVSKSEDEIW